MRRDKALFTPFTAACCALVLSLGLGGACSDDRDGTTPPPDSTPSTADKGVAQDQGQTTEGGGDASTGPASASVSLDSKGVVQTTITVYGPGGAKLTLYKGSQVSAIEAGKPPKPVTATSGVTLSIDDKAKPVGTLPKDMDYVSAAHIGLKVAGKAITALVSPPSTVTISGSGAGSPKDQGLKLEIPIGWGGAMEAAPGVLYKAKYDKTVYKLSVATVAHGAFSVGFNLPGTGDYQLAKFKPVSSVSVPPGMYWSKVSVKGTVHSVRIIEGSTAQILGVCFLDKKDTDVTGPSYPNDQRFWCKRTLNTSTGMTDIVVHSKVANLPLLRVSISKPSPAVKELTGSVLNAPGAKSYTDPYSDSALKFGGYKHITLVSKNLPQDCLYELGEKPLSAAGYKPVLQSFFGGSSNVWIADIALNETLDARLLVQQKVLEKAGWQARASKVFTVGNRGTYDYQGVCPGKTFQRWHISFGGPSYGTFFYRYDANIVGKYSSPCYSTTQYATVTAGATTTKCGFPDTYYIQPEKKCYNSYAGSTGKNCIYCSAACPPGAKITVKRTGSSLLWQGTCGPYKVTLYPDCK